MSLVRAQELSVPYATVEQVIAAYMGLTDVQRKMLRKVAARLIGGTSYSESQDLMHEALGRSLDGRRNWDLADPFYVFFAGAMRSIANGSRSKNKRLVELDDGAEGARLTAPSTEEYAMDAEQVQLTRKMAERLMRMFDEDEPAQNVISGLSAGLSPKEMRESFHLDERAFDTTFKRVVRRARARLMH